MERQLWFDAVGRGSSMANYAVPIANPGNFNVSYASNNSVSQVPGRTTPVQNTPNTSPIPNRGNTGNVTVNDGPDPLTQTIACNQCQNGYPVGNLFSGTVCPTGWTTDIDPCATRGTNTNTTQVVPNVADPVRGNGNVVVSPNVDTPANDPMVSVKCYQCQGGVAVENIFTKPQSNPICDNGWTNDANIDCGVPTLTDDQIVDVVNPGLPPAPIYQNVCYSCVDGVPQADVFPSEIKDLCPEGYSQDNKVCEDAKTGDTADVKTAGFDNKLILYIAIGVGAYLLLKK